MASNEAVFQKHVAWKQAETWPEAFLEKVRVCLRVGFVSMYARMFDMYVSVYADAFMDIYGYA